METNTTPETEKIKQLVQRLDGGPPFNANEYQAALSTFERYECWNPYFRLINRNIEDPKARSTQDFINLIRVQNIYLEDLFAAAETFSKMIHLMQLDYEKVRDEILPQTIEFEDFSAEATLLHSGWSQFKKKEDQVQCLERMCMLYEKKTHNESLLADTYQTLLEVDPKNVKALRYFKMVYTQNNEWDQVVRTLMTLLQSVKHPQEHFRVAQELAAIFLYQLDLPKEAIDVIESHCAESPLDTSTILFDAYHRLGDWNGCQKVLRQTLLTVDDNAERAVIHHKIAQTAEHLQDFDEAFDNYVKAAELWPQFLDPVEGLLTIALAKKDWGTVKTWLTKLTQSIQDQDLNSQLKQALTRLEDGLSHAKQH